MQDLGTEDLNKGWMESPPLIHSGLPIVGSKHSWAGWNWKLHDRAKAPLVPSLCEKGPWHEQLVLSSVTLPSQV